MVIPKFVLDPSILVQPGYQEAHKIYDEIWQFFAQKEMSVHNDEVVVIKIRMMSLKPGHQNPLIVSVHEINVWLTFGCVSNHSHLLQNLSETVSNIPVYIGVQELKRIAYFTLPPFMKWSRDYTLSIEDL